MARYAAETIVSAEQSEQDLKRELKRYGASGVMTAEDWRDGNVMVQFELEGFLVRLRFPLPKQDEFGETPTGRRRRSKSVQTKAWEQACRQRWRGVVLVVKAKLEAIESGFETVEHAFLADVLLPDGKTVGEHVLPGVESAYREGKMPKGLLPFFKGD